ncbi:unnamed protein product, partial [marine sediment metagenome]
MPPRVRDRDLGWQRIKKDIKNLDSFITKVGFPSDGKVAPAKSLKDDKIAITDMSDMVMVA